MRSCCARARCMQAPEIAISVAYALPQRQTILELRVPQGTTVADAVSRSGLPSRFPELADAPLHCAIFGRAVPLTHIVEDGDRVEILRPLLIDPKESRRRAAARARK
jgi:putative ubiquitin-RnfH superfamily antitoxin RatB of RatAB toxin-antitoxin module